MTVLTGRLSGYYYNHWQDLLSEIESHSGSQAQAPSLRQSPSSGPGAGGPWLVKSSWNLNSSWSLCDSDLRAASECGGHLGLTRAEAPALQFKFTGYSETDSEIRFTRPRPRIFRFVCRTGEVTARTVRVCNSRVRLAGGGAAEHASESGKLKYASHSFKGALHQSRNEQDGHWVLGRTIPDLKLSLQLKRHVYIGLSYLRSTALKTLST